MSEPNEQSQESQHNTPSAAPAAGSTPLPGSAVAIASSKEAKRIRSLETDVSRLQKLLQDKEGELSSLQEITKVAAQTPSAKTPGASVLDDLNNLLGIE